MTISARFCRSVILAALAAAAFQSRAAATTWRLDGRVQGLHDLASKTLAPVDETELTISTHTPAGAVFFEANDGVSVRSTGLPGIVDQDGAGKINMLTVGGVPSAGAESIAFSFDKPGYITGFDFDGVKDETLEHFVLTSTGGVRVNFFDSAANTSNPGAVDNAPPGTLFGEVVFLLENAQFDDDARDLRIPFTAGQQFVLTYAELPSVNIVLHGVGDGARIQGIIAQLVPEPGATTLLFVAIATALATCRRSQLRPRSFAATPR